MLYNYVLVNLIPSGYMDYMYSKTYNFGISLLWMRENKSQTIIANQCFLHVLEGRVMSHTSMKQA